MATEQSQSAAASASSLKRARSPTEPTPLPAAKIPRTATNHLQINYLARQNKDTIPLVSHNDQLTEIARLIGEYDGVLHRNESMAGNLGACPLGPILLKRFERLFDGPPRVLKAHAKDVTVSWLDVVEFAQNNPKQFNLERTRNGIRVCQFYTKQCRVEISEEDFVLIASGMPQKLIPPQPILEDEEKELGAIDLLDRNLGLVIQIADQVSGRARQLIHKMKNRRNAILSRREQEAEAHKRQHALAAADGSPLSPVDTNGVGTGARPVRSIELSQSPPAGFTAVNLRPPVGAAAAAERDRRISLPSSELRSSHHDDFYSPSHASNITIINGKSIKDASPAARVEMMKKFLTPGDRDAGLDEEMVRRSSLGGHRSSLMHAFAADKPRSRSIDDAADANSKGVAIPNTPASLMPHAKPSSMDKDDGGPFKLEMVRRMDNMWKGDRIVPPCDRCRRLHMDCLKNLTACMGCTKKHAKCSWKEVKASELHLQESSSKTPDDNAAPVTPVTPVPMPLESATAPPMVAGSTIEVNPPAADEATRPAPVGRGSLDVADDARELASDSNAPVAVVGRTSERTGDAETATRTPSRFDVRPPPLVQPGPEAANGRALAGHGRPSFTSVHSAPDATAADDAEDDEGDRLQALAARVYRSASQSGHRP